MEIFSLGTINRRGRRIHTSRNLPKNRKGRILALLHVDQEADESVEKDDEDCAKCRSKEEYLLARWISVASSGTSVTDGIEQRQGSQPHSGVHPSCTKVLQGVDEDPVC